MDVGVGFKVSTGLCGFMAATTSHLIVYSSSLRPVLPYDGLDGTPAVLRPCTASVPPWMMPDAYVHHQWPWAPSRKSAFEKKPPARAGMDL